MIFFMLVSGHGRVINLVNLDYRKGKIDLSDLNCDQKYDANEAFTRSQLANMLVLRELAKLWSKESSSRVLNNKLYQ